MIGSKLLIPFEIVALAKVGEVSNSGKIIQENLGNLWWAVPLFDKDCSCKILTCSPFASESEKNNAEAEEFLKRHGWESYKYSDLAKRFVEKPPTQEEPL